MIQLLQSPFINFFKKNYLYLILFILLGFSQSLWEEQGEIFSDEKFLAIGDIIQINFSTRNAIELNRKITQQKNSDYSLLNQIKNQLNFIPNINLQSVNSTKSKSIELDDNIDGTFSVIITEVNEKNKKYFVSGTQRLTLSGFQQIFQITGQLSVKDVIDRKADSLKLANLSLSLGEILIDKRGRVVSSKINIPVVDNQSNEQTNNSLPISAELKQELYEKFLKLFLESFF